ncbi:tyrosine-type recombinase/integrase [Roseovarius mucosus]|uniref:tyrosine-type recombinase/integrase n=1 Tax=Roseovarius mucosus TaxID=215743 RepID=UPI0035CE94C9
MEDILIAKSNEFTVAKLKSLPSGKYCDGQGLWLHKRADGGAQWVFRFRLWGRQREMGLGSLKTVSLADARRKADAVRQQVYAGVDPIKERRLQRQQANARDGRLEALAMATFEAQKPSLKGANANGAWLSPLRVHVLPKLGQMPIVKIDQDDIARALASIWHEKTVTAKKAISRLRIVFKYARAKGFLVNREVIEEAVIILGENKKPSKPSLALPWSEVPAFYQTLADEDPTQLALRMLILTGVRANSVINMQLSQINGSIWNIPALFVKGRLSNTTGFDVPLSPEALNVIELAKKNERTGYLFPNSTGGPLNKMSMRNYLVDKKVPARPHGFRSSLRTWLSDQAQCPFEVAEACIGHVRKGDAAIDAYNRTSYLTQRIPYMHEWAAYVSGNS